MRRIDVSKYFEMSNLSNVGLTNVAEKIRREEQERRLTEGRGWHRNVFYTIRRENSEIEVNLEFGRTPLRGTITISINFTRGTIRIKAEDMKLPLMAFVDFNHDIYYVPRGPAGTVEIEDLNIEGTIRQRGPIKDVVIGSAVGDVYVRIGGIRLWHANFSDSGGMCTGTLPRVTPLTSLPSLITLYLKAIAMPTSHAYATDCDPVGTDIIFRECRRVLNDRYFYRSDRPPSHPPRGVSIEEELEEELKECIDQVC